MEVIQVRNVSKKFRRHVARKLIRDHVRDLFQRQPDQYFYALRDVSFAVQDGESVALVGSNGAGKSTLLSIVAGLCRPDEGSVHVGGRVAALLELGSGFHPDLTGVENVMLNAALLGFTENEAKSRMAQIVEFSELAEFVNEPIRTYSSGMVARLAFSVAVHVDPAVVIIDETLSVGDAHFTDKCADKLASLRRQGKTLLCVSHAAATVRQFCDRAIWLHHGKLMMDGPAENTLAEYVAYTQAPQVVST
jgi:ABC-type polysaccharide/polyol phosphate transport system ATPase subunit